MEFTLEDLLASTNIAEELDDQTLVEIGKAVHEGYTTDCATRAEWEERYDEYMDLAMQVVEKKNTPWPNAANSKYPILTTAAIQFSSRAYPALVSGSKIVKAKVSGFDTTGEKMKAAVRVGLHMSYQILEEMDDWEEEMDKLCVTLPIIGCMFKKTYYDVTNERNCSKLVYPKELVVNYWASSLEDAPRKTHVLEMSSNDIYERKAAGLYRDIELRTPKPEGDSDSDNRTGLSAPEEDRTTPYEILEQHCFWDLDGDGYEEPYIITIDSDSQQVLRIVARWTEEDVKRNENGDLIRITPMEYFTKYTFVPNPDGGFYDIGFGVLLGPTNDIVNTLLNQLIDAGTLSVMNAGFISKGIRIKGGEKAFKPGEWKTVNSTGDDLRKGIVPLPTQAPSSVLFNLLNLLIEGAYKLGSVTDILTGENPGQNQPATTTMAVIEQGLKVFSSIYKRMHRSLSKEFKKLYKLNRLYLPPQVYFNILDMPVEIQTETDYKLDTSDVQPQADPNVASESQRLVKAQALAELIPLGNVNPQVATYRILEAQDQPGIQEIMTMPQQPDFWQTPEGKMAIDKSNQEWALLKIKAREAGIKEFKAVSDANNTLEGILQQQQQSAEEMKSDSRDSGTGASE